MNTSVLFKQTSFTLKTDGRFKERIDGRDKVGYNLSASTEMNIVKVFKYPRR